MLLALSSLILVKYRKDEKYKRQRLRIHIVTKVSGNKLNAAYVKSVERFLDDKIVNE